MFAYLLTYLLFGIGALSWLVVWRLLYIMPCCGPIEVVPQSTFEQGRNKTKNSGVGGCANTLIFNKDGARMDFRKKLIFGTVLLNFSKN